MKAIIGEKLGMTQIFNDEGERVAVTVVAAGPKAILDIPWSPLFVACLWLLHPGFGWYAAACAALLAALAVLNELVARSPAGEASRARVANERFTEQALRSAEALSAMGMLPGLLHRWQARNAEVLSMQRRLGDRSAWIQGASRFVRTAAPVGILALGAWYVVLAELSAGGMIAASILLGRALAPLEQMIAAWRGLITARSARARLAELAERFEVQQPLCAAGQESMNQQQVAQA